MTDDFRAARIVRSAEIRLDAPPERVFPLFQPREEAAWAAGWAPRFRWPADGTAAEGAVFVTHPPDEPETIWTVTRHDPTGGRIVYGRITPGSRAGQVEVACRADGEGATRARVTYTFTALSPAGNDWLAAFTEAHYADYLRGWEAAINHHLSTGEHANAP
jgi:hypothetical protein